MADEFSCSAFFQAYAPRLRAFLEPRISQKFRRRFDVDDIVSSAFRSFFLRPRTEADQTGDWNPWPLLIEIAIHKLARQVRRNTASGRTILREQREAEQSRDGESPSEQAELAEIQALVETSLDAEARRAWRLRLQGCELLEIAEQLRLSERTIRRYLNHAKSRLQELLQESRRVQYRASCHAPEDVQSRWTSFSHFTLQRQIGAGLVGKVYQAVDKRSGTTVAIKFLKKEMTTSNAARDSILAEMRFGLQLRHSSIVSLSGIGTTPIDGLFLVMDYLPGGSLAERLKRQRTNLQELKSWLLPVIDGLEAAHSAGILHCDLKPANLLFDLDGQPKITDFGFAQWMTAGGGGIPGGTPAYLAPELIDPTFGEPGPWTDVFGLGALIRESLTGEPPYMGSSTKEIFNQILSTEPIGWPAHVARQIPASWREFCDRCLQKRSNDRPASLGELRTIVAGLDQR